jgi:hypothetical protein
MRLQKRRAIADAQEDDGNIGSILAMMKNHSNKPFWDKVAELSADAKALWRQWDNLRLFHGMLMRRFMNPDGRPNRLQTIMPRSRRMSFITLLHEGPFGGQMTYEKMR